MASKRCGLCLLTGLRSRRFTPEPDCQVAFAGTEGKVLPFKGSAGTNDTAYAGVLGLSCPLSSELARDVRCFALADTGPCSGTDGKTLPITDADAKHPVLAYETAHTLCQGT